MSATIDNKVVEMSFDNSKFESNVKTSINTLEQLKSSLNFDGMEESFSDLEKSANDISFDSLVSSVESLENRFSVFGIAGMEIIQKLTDSMMNLANKTISFLTNGIINGGITRAMNLENAHFMLQGLLADEEEVEAVMQNVNDAVDGTAYSLDAAAMVASQLVASGYTAGEQMESSLRAVAGVAAMTNSEYSDIGDIFVTVAGNGKLMTEQLRQFSYRGLNVAATLADYLEISETEARDMVSAGLIDFKTFSDAMDDAFGEHAKAANETFSGAMANIGSALARIGADFVSPLIEQNGVLVTLFNTIREKINEARTYISPLADSFVDFVSRISESLTDKIGNLDLSGPFEVFYNVLESVQNILKGIKSFISPVAQAFKNIFPGSIIEGAVTFTEKLASLTEKFRLSESAAEKLTKVFEGFFSIIDIGLTAIKEFITSFSGLLKNFSGIGTIFLNVTSNIGTFITRIRDTVKEAGVFNTIFTGVVNVLQKVIDKFKEFASVVKESFNASGLNGFSGIFQGILNVIKKIFSGIVEFLNAIGTSDFSTVLSGGILVTLIYQLKTFVNSIRNLWNSLKPFGTLSSLMDQLRVTLYAYQNNLRADSLMKIAEAIIILAAAMLILSTLDSESLGETIGVVAIMLTELVGAMAMLQKFTAGGVGLMGSITGLINSFSQSRMYSGLIKMAAAIGILAVSLKVLSTIDTGQMASSLGAITVLFGDLTAAMIAMNKLGGKVKGAMVMISLATSILILSKALKSLSDLSWEEIAKGITAVTALCADLVFSMVALNKLGGKVKGIVAMISLAAAIKILSSACMSLAEMSWEEIAKGITAVTALCADLVFSLVALNKLGGKNFATGLALIEVGAALEIVANVFKKMGGYSWEDIAKGLVAIGGALAEFAIALNFMKGTVGASAALLIAAAAIDILTPAIKVLGKMSITEIAAALIVLAGAFTVIGVAAKLLSGSILTILGLAAAFTLMGVGVAAVGLGLVAAGAGLSSIAVGLVALAGSVTATIEVVIEALGQIVLAIIGYIPDIVVAIGQGLLDIVLFVADNAPVLVNALLEMILSLIEGLATKIPEIVTALMQLIIGIINALAENIPDIIIAVMNLLGTIFQGIVDAINNIDASSLIQGIVCIGLLSGLVLALSAIAGLVPAAMGALAELAVLVGEMGLVFAAFGAFAQIPGLTWLIDEGAGLLYSIGNAIGSFIGGIVGGIATGITGSFPQIGADLSAFMENVTPFIEGASNIDSSSMDGVTSLAKAILAITAADILDGLARWFTGGSSLAEFGEDLAAFGPSFAEYGNAVSGIDAEVVEASANAALALAQMAKKLPKSGGLASVFAGENNLGEFSSYLPDFGENLKAYSDAIVGMDPEVVEASANAALALAQMAKKLPNSGGLVALFTGDNNLGEFSSYLPDFGVNLKSYSDSIEGMNPDVVEASADAALALAQMAKKLPNSGGFVALFTGDNNLGEFSSYLPEFGKNLKDYSDAIDGFDSEAVVESMNAAQAISEFADGLPSYGGIVDWFTGGQLTLSDFGAELVAFAPNMVDYAKIIDDLDTSSVESSAAAVKCLVEIADNLPNQNGLIDWIKGTASVSLSDFGEELADFAPNIVEYADAVKEIDTSGVEGSANAAKILMELADHLPDSNGRLSQWIGGTMTLSDFGKELVDFAPNIVKYADTVNEIDTSYVRASANAAKILMELADYLPSTDGRLSQWIGGTMKLSDFGEEIADFAPNIVDYANNVIDINTSGVEGSANAAKCLMELADYLPSTDGRISEWIGGTMSLSDYGKELAAFAPKITDYADNVGDLTADSVEDSANAAKILMELADHLPSTDGKLSQWIGGTMSLSDFGEEMASFAPYIKDYVNGVGDIETSHVRASANAAMILMDLADNLPSTDGRISEWIGGTMKLSDFGKEISDFAPNIVNYARAVKKIDTSGVEGSANAAKCLMELADYLPSTDGRISEWIGGTMSLSDFGKELAAFAPKITDYVNGVSELETDSVEGSANAAKCLMELADYLPDSNGRLSQWIGGTMTLSDYGVELAAFAPYIKDYVDGVKDINSSNVESSAAAAGCLLALAENLPETSGIIGWFSGGTMSLAAFGRQLVAFAPNMGEFVDNAGGITKADVCGPVSAANYLFKITENLPEISDNVMSLSDFGAVLPDFGKNMKNFVDDTKDLTGSDVTGIREVVTSTQEMLDDLGNVDFSAVDTFESSIARLGKITINEFADVIVDSESVVTTAFDSVFDTIAAHMQTQKISSTLSDAFDKVMENAISGVSGNSETYGKVGEDLMEAFADGIEDKASTIDTNIATVVGSAIDAIKSEYNSFKGAGEDCITNFISGVQDNVSKVKSSFSSPLKDAVSGVKNYYQNFYTAGKYLVQGFAKGIDDNTYLAKAKATNMAKAASTAADKALKVNSPSKVGYATGNYYGLGFVNGIDSMTQAAKNAGENMANSAQSGLEDAISIISTALNDEIDMEPTIRPVLDLDDVRSGAQSISSMLSSNQSLSYAINAAGNISSREIQNGTTMDDLLHAIKHLGSDLADVGPKNTYNVNGITYDDGSSIADAVGQLVHAAKIGKRV